MPIHMRYRVVVSKSEAYRYLQMTVLKPQIKILHSVIMHYLRDKEKMYDKDPLKLPWSLSCRFPSCMYSYTSAMQFVSIQ